MTLAERMDAAPSSSCLLPLPQKKTNQGAAREGKAIESWRVGRPAGIALTGGWRKGTAGYGAVNPILAFEVKKKNFRRKGLAPDDTLLIHQIINDFDAVPQLELGLLRHRQDSS